MELDMLSAVRSRTKSYGISTAAPFLRQFEQCVGGNCPSKYFDGVSAFRWQKAVEAAERQLIYHHPEMDFAGDFSKFDKSVAVDGLPPHTIATFPAVITTTTQDRDGDVLETKGAQLDPKACLLYQHLPFENIGRLLKEGKHTSKLLMGDFSICGTPLGDDCAMLAEHGSLRISHGFTTDDYEPLDEKEYDIPGFHVFKFKILEVSLVSIPSNPDAEITQFSRNKLHSPIAKAFAEYKYNNRPVVSAVGIDLSALPAGTSVTFTKAVAEDKNPAAASCQCKSAAHKAQSAEGRRLPQTAEEHDMVAKGHGCVVASCGHIVEQCRCHGGSLIRAKLDGMCDECSKSVNTSNSGNLADKARERVEQVFGLKSVVPYKETPASKSDSWDADSAVSGLRKWSGVDGEDPSADAFSKYKLGFGIQDGDADKLGSYSYPHHQVDDGKLTVNFKGCAAVIAALNGGRGGTSLSEADRKKLYNHIAKHYKDSFPDSEVPELKAVAPLRYKGQDRDFYNPETGAKSRFLNAKGVYVEFENSFDDIREDLNDSLLPFLMVSGEADADDFCYIVDLFLYQALVQVCERSYGYGPYDVCYPVSDDERCYYLIDWEMGPDEEPVWSGTPQPVEVTPQITVLDQRAFEMFVKSMPAAHVRKLKKAMGHCSAVMGHDDATDATSGLAKKAFGAIQTVHDAHAEKAALSDEHAKSLTKAMGYCSKGMDHEDSTDDIKSQFKSAHTAVKSVMDDMDMTGEESLETLIAKFNKAGRRISAANEKKIKAAATFYKAIADDDEADSDVATLALNGYQAVTDIFETGGDAANDYDAEGNYTGNDLHANMADGQSTNLPDGKEGRAISKETGAKIQKAISHGKAIIAHEKADAGHKSLATKAVNKLASVIGETPHQDADGNNERLVTQDEPEKSFKEVCDSQMRDAIVEHALTGNLSALQKFAAESSAASKSANDTITRIERQRQYDAEEAVISNAVASV